MQPGWHVHLKEKTQSDMQTLPSCLRPLSVFVAVLGAVYLLKGKSFFTVSRPPHSRESSYWLRFQNQQLPLAEHGELWLVFSLFGTSSSWLQNSYGNTMCMYDEWSVRVCWCSVCLCGLTYRQGWAPWEHGSQLLDLHSANLVLISMWKQLYMFSDYKFISEICDPIVPFVLEI